MRQLLKQRRAPNCILGLALEGGRIEGVVLRRNNGSLLPQQTLAAPLALNPLNDDPELVGREIRNLLEQAGVRERRCVVCVPLHWALTLHIKVPDLPEEDLDSFAEIEAERGFPYSPDSLLVSKSFYRAPGGERHLTLVAIPRNHLQQLERVLRAAQLRPLSFTLGVTCLQAAGQESVFALVPRQDTVELQATCGGGVAALRTIEGAIEGEGAQRRLYPDVLAREIRVTLGQLPDVFRRELRAVRLFGSGEMAQRCAQELAPRLEAMALRIESVRTYAPAQFRSQPPPETPVSPAFSAAALRLTGAGSPFEFLPPKVSPWQRFSTRVSSRKLFWVGGSAAAAAVIIGGVIFVQQWQLSRLRTEWTAMEPRVHELEEMQQQIRRFRPWFDTSFQNLTIMRRVTEAFPIEGVVTAKTLEIRDLASVTCSGVARDNQAFLRLLDQLRGTKEVGGLKVDMVRGKNPLQFTLNFQWGRGGANEN